MLASISALLPASISKKAEISHQMSSDIIFVVSVSMICVFVPIPQLLQHGFDLKHKSDVLRTKITLSFYDF